MRKKLLSGLVAGVAALTALALFGAGVAYAVSTYRIGGTTNKQYIATSDSAWLVPGPNTWQTVPVTGITVVIPPRTRQLITARYSAESQCLGAGWCSVRIVYTGGGPLTELAPASGTDYAFDSDGDLWDQHTVERTSATYLPPGSYQVSVQAQRVSATQFRLDDYHFIVGLIAP